MYFFFLPFPFDTQNICGSRAIKTMNIREKEEKMQSENKCQDEKKNHWLTHIS